MENDFWRNTEPKRRVSVDRPTEPTYPWRKPSIAEVDTFSILYFKEDSDRWA